MRAVLFAGALVARVFPQRLGPMRGVFCSWGLSVKLFVSFSARCVWYRFSGTSSAKLFPRCSDRCVESSAPELPRPRVLPAYRANAWSLMLRTAFGQAFCPLVWAMSGTFLLRSSLGQRFCPLIGPMRGVFCSGTFSAKFSPAYRADAWSLRFRRPVG